MSNNNVFDKNPLISVIIPIYNVEQFLSDCLDTVLWQTYKNLEIILVDDGSQDNSGQICDDFASRDNRIKVIHKKNGGVSSARNTGIDISTGEYIAFIDPDDCITKDYFSTHISTIKSEQADTSAVLVQEMIDFIDIKSAMIINPSPATNFEIKTEIESLNCILDKNRPWVGYCWNKVFSASIIKDNKLYFDEGISMNEDSLFNCNYLLHASKVALIDARKYIYRIHKQSVTRKMTIKSYLSKLNAYIKIIKIARNFHDSIFLKRVSVEFIKTWFAGLHSVIKLDNSKLSSLYKMNNILSEAIRNVKLSQFSNKLKVSILTYLISPKLCTLLYKVNIFFSNTFAKTKK